MQRFSSLQRNFLKGFMTKLLMLPAFWFFFKAIYPLYAYPWIDPVIYIMLTMFDWLCLMLVFVAAATLDIMITTGVGLKQIMTVLHLRRNTHTTISTADRSEEKQKPKPLY